MRNEKRYQDIEEVVAAGIDVISTVNIQHLESLNDRVFELTGVRVRETFPDRILEEADEVVLVDLSPEALQERLRAGKVYAPERAATALTNFFQLDNLGVLRELALREVAEDAGARRQTAVLDPLSQEAVAERVLALVEPQPKSQRIIRRAWRSAQRLGAELDTIWVRRPGHEPTEEEATQLAALRRLAGILGVHFLEVEGDNLVDTVRRVARERGSTYIFVGTPDESRRREIFGGSLAFQDGARAARHRHPRDRRPRAQRRGQTSELPARDRSAALGSRSLCGAALRAGPCWKSAGEARARPLHPWGSRGEPCSMPRSESRAPRTPHSSPPIDPSSRSSSRYKRPR